MNPEIIAQLRDRFGDSVKFNEPLAPYLAYRIGGPADILIFPKSEEDLLAVSKVSKELRLPITVVGSGTNLLVRDEGIRGITVALINAFNTIEVLETKSDRTLIRVGGGVPKPALLDWAIDAGLTGLEFSAGVPGSIGGGIFMNAGTKYGCYGDILKELRVFDFARGAITLNRKEVHFGYREQSAVRGSLVLSATFELTPGNREAIRTEVNRIIDERAEKQPLDFPSCGSTFKNPEGLSAGRLIEKAGLKGERRGDAEISLKHANFILNKGKAKASDILELIELVKSKVFEQFGVHLECEVVVLGGNGVETSTHEAPKIPHSY